MLRELSFYIDRIHVIDISHCGFYTLTILKACPYLHFGNRDDASFCFKRGSSS